MKLSMQNFLQFCYWWIIITIPFCNSSTLNQTFYGVVLQQGDDGLEGYTAFITDDYITTNISLGIFYSNYSHSEGCFGLDSYYWSYYTTNIMNESAMCTNLFVISPLDSTYMFGQFENETIALYCLDQMDYPLLNVAKDVSSSSVYVSYMSPTEFKVNTVLSSRIPEELLTENTTMLTSLFSSPDIFNCYLCVGNYPAFVVFNIFEDMQYEVNLFQSNEYGCENTLQQQPIDNYTFAFMFGSDIPLEVNVIAQAKTSGQWYLGTLDFVLAPDEAVGWCFIKQTIDLPTNEEFLIADVNATAFQMVVLMSNGLYDVNLASGAVTLLGFEGDPQGVQEIASINYLNFY
ncbi:hypothetical protein RFI_35326 [Reticulomyxa filosa]|uniref:Uncharacterized protein n=1 Tax=Reticulomyxa filosa TaxID=46433 RepID=X6LN08_RETFI|nr:hypothetical protein RFI_35326 [Reticulomyxa filosa]|eukprot:ETO02110.1 hypothetical protein RFI_35326 [Reticulomyxa filosa]